MKRYQVKVCGNKYVNNFLKVADLGVDYVGFIFYEKSPRYVENELIFSVFPNAFKVGVFVNASLDTILEKVNTYGLDVVQLHGDESVAFCQQLRAAESEKTFEIWKAFGIDAAFDFRLLTTYQHVVNSFVFDTKTSDYGGSGKRFDWTLLTNYSLSTPFFLSGGIRLADAATLKNSPHPRCLGFDINSGFELEPGIKNTTEIKAFIAGIHA